MCGTISQGARPDGHGLFHKSPLALERMQSWRAFGRTTAAFSSQRDHPEHPP
jgi:hypothetical protein